MNTSHIYMSTYDHLRLRELVASADDRLAWDELNAELRRATVVPAHVRVPPHVVTVGSRVTLRDQLTGACIDAVLTLPGAPGQASAAEVSVLDPLGTALLGCMHGDVITFRCGDAVREVKITDVVQSPVAKAAAALASNEDAFANPVAAVRVMAETEGRIPTRPRPSNNTYNQASALRRLRPEASVAL